MLLCTLTKYVGTIYPGENSIINEINIVINNSFNFDKKFIYIYSKKLDKRFPVILNKLTFGKYNLEFNTSEKPILNHKLSKINAQIKKKVNAIKENVLIIGASSGIGFYPSTTFINEKDNSHYTQVKILGEYALKKINSQKVNINICRISEVKTKQNLSLIPKKLPNFGDLLNNNKYYQKLFFLTDGNCN